MSNPDFVPRSTGNYSLELERVPACWLPALNSVHILNLLSRLHLADGIDSPGQLSAESASPEVDWASNCLGRALACYYGWDDTAWSIEDSGILFTPVYYDARGEKAHLVKTTRRPVPPDLTGCWHWLAELKAHCRVLGCRRGVLHVYHAADESQEPVLLAYEFEFDRKELEALWDVLVDLRRKYGERKCDL